MFFLFFAEHVSLKHNHNFPRARDRLLNASQHWIITLFPISSYNPQPDVLWTFRSPRLRQANQVWFDWLSKENVQACNYRTIGLDEFFQNRSMNWWNNVQGGRQVVGSYRRKKSPYIIPQGFGPRFPSATRRLEPARNLYPPFNTSDATFLYSPPMRLSFGFRN